jgi:hypothetical protein
MKRPGTVSLDQELARGEISLDSLPSLIKEVRELSGQAAQCSVILAKHKDRVAGASHLPLPDQTRMRRGFLRKAARLRRGLLRRITWLSLRLFWRRIRFWLLIALILAVTALAAGWAIKNRDWLVDQLTGRSGAPPAASGSPVPAPSLQGPGAASGGAP